MRCSSPINQRSFTAFSGIITNLKNPVFWISLIIFVLYWKIRQVPQNTWIPAESIANIFYLVLNPATVVYTVRPQPAVIQLRPKCISITNQIVSGIRMTRSTFMSWKWRLIIVVPDVVPSYLVTGDPGSYTLIAEMSGSRVADNILTLSWWVFSLKSLRFQG